MNQVAIIGNLTKDPDLKYTETGLAVCNFTVAINEKYKDKEKTHFIPAVTWQTTAENCSKYLAKGSKVGIEGSLQYQQWEDKEGKKKNKILVLVKRVEFLDKKKDDSGEETPNLGE